MRPARWRGVRARGGGDAPALILKKSATTAVVNGDHGTAGIDHPQNSRKADRGNVVSATSETVNCPCCRRTLGDIGFLAAGETWKSGPGL